MKKMLVITLLLCLMLSISLTSFADDSTIKVNIDNIEQSYEQPPVIVNGSTLVPMRAIFESLGAEITWDGNTRTVTAVKDNITISIPIDSLSAIITTDGVSKTVTLNTAASIINSRTMVPVRFVSEALGCEVSWDGDTRSINITSSTSDKKEDGSGRGPGAMFDLTTLESILDELVDESEITKTQKEEILAYYEELQDSMPQMGEKPDFSDMENPPEKPDSSDDTGTPPEQDENSQSGNGNKPNGLFDTLVEEDIITQEQADSIMEKLMSMNAPSESN